MIAAVLVLCAAAAAGQPAAGITAEEVVERVQRRYDATADFEALVAQEIVLADTGQVLRAHGRVVFAKPGRMRWEIENGLRQIIVTDGKTLWFYEPEERQVLRAPFDRAFRSTSPISFLTGVGRIDDDFRAALVGREDGLLRLRLEPRRDPEELGTLVVLVDPAAWDIVGADIEDPLGNVTRLRFSDRRRNAGVEEELFRFKPPEGVDVFDAPIGY